MKPFIYEGTIISNPNIDETGRFVVDPVNYYGQAYLDYLEELILNTNK
jgi:hypothetical protein